MNGAPRHKSQQGFEPHNVSQGMAQPVACAIGLVNILIIENCHRTVSVAVTIALEGALAGPAEHTRRG